MVFEEKVFNFNGAVYCSDHLVCSVFGCLVLVCLRILYLFFLNKRSVILFESILLAVCIFMCHLENCDNNVLLAEPPASLYC